jgi:YfiH family protein
MFTLLTLIRPMKKTKIAGLNFWQFEILGDLPRISHVVTERNSHSSEGEFTLSYSSLPDRTKIEHNRSLLAEAMEIEKSKLFLPSQVHKTRIVHVTSSTAREELMETDALVSNEPGIGIAVMSADCVPILLFDQKNNAIAAVHSGWRGTVARILEKTLHTMSDIFGSRGQDLLAGIGPSVCQDSYEVGEEVVEAVDKAFSRNMELLIPQQNNKAKLDLWKANKIQLMEFGVPESQIEISNLCTVKNNMHFFSARKGDTGRFAAGISLQERN